MVPIMVFGNVKMNKRQKENLTRQKTCMWGYLVESPFKFICQLRNLEPTTEKEKAIEYCKSCRCFQDTNIEIEGGYFNL